MVSKVSKSWISMEHSRLSDSSSSLEALLIVLAQRLAEFNAHLACEHARGDLVDSLQQFLQRNPSLLRFGEKELLYRLPLTLGLELCVDLCARALEDRAIAVVHETRG